MYKGNSYQRIGKNHFLTARNAVLLHQNQKPSVMKRFIISLILIFATWQAAFAMSYERAREEALYLTDKMAYELNLNDQQYNDAYEINLDYFLALDSEADLYADYLSYRLSDLRHILYDWQYNLLLAADYFIRPVYWRAGGWYFPIYAHYTVGHFYYSYPTVYYSYHGGHGRIHYNRGFYVSRRPVWNGGFRSHQPIGGRGRIGHGTVHHNGGSGYGGRHQYENDRRGYGRTDRGNSFGNSSSRNYKNDNSGRPGYDRDRNNKPDNNTIDNHSRPDNSDLGNRNHDGMRNPDMSSRNHERSSRSYEGSRSSVPSRSGMGSSHSSGPSRNGGSFSGGSRGGGSSFGGGSRGGGSLGGASRGGGGAARGGRR